MKTLITLIVLTALVGFGGAFLEKWKIPGLENFPTASSIQARLKAQPEPGDPLKDLGVSRTKTGNEARPPGYFATGTNSATTNRNQQLQKATKEMGVD